jgi:phospholipid-transporting ATPase
MLLFTNFVPISLIVTLEVVKFLQAIFISWDLDIYHEPTDTPTKV